MTVHTRTPVGYVPQAIDLPNLPHGIPPELIDAIKDGARDVFDQHGPTAFEMSREAALAHEAGHAIVGAHEGLIIRSVTISSRHVPNFGALWGGWCTEGGGRWTTGPDSTADENFSISPAPDSSSQASSARWSPARTSRAHRSRRWRCPSSSAPMPGPSSQITT